MRVPSETVKIYGKVTAKVGDEVYRTDNIKTNLYRTYHANWLTYDYPINYYTGSPSIGRYSIAVGYGTAEPSCSDTSLGSELYRKPVAVRYTARSYTARFMTTFSSLEPPVPYGSASVHIAEYGLYDEQPVTLVNNSFTLWSSGSPTGWSYAGSTTYKGPTSSAIYRYEQSGSAGYSVVDGTVGSFNLWQDVTFDNSWRSQPMTFKMAVKESPKNAGSQSIIYLADSKGTTYSGTYSSLGTAYQVLSVTRTIDSEATSLRIGLISYQGYTYFDWANLYPNGKLLARALIDIDKGSTQPMSLTWDIYLDEVEEGEAMGYKAYAFEKITLGTVTAGSLGSASYQPSGSASAERAVISVEDNTIRYRYDGGTPDSSSGHQAYDGDTFALTDLTNIEQFRAISIGSGSAVIAVTYER